MSKRNMRPIYPHEGFVLRSVKSLSNGSELLHCAERKTTAQCRAVGRRSPDGTITLTTPHHSHSPDGERVKAKLARVEVKKMAEVSDLTPHEIINQMQVKFGHETMGIAGNATSLSRMIQRQRKNKDPEPDPFALLLEATQNVLELDPFFVKSNAGAVELHLSSIKPDPDAVDLNPFSIKPDADAVESNSDAVETDPDAVVEPDPDAEEPYPDVIEESLDA